jgi:RNA polymerase sigma factor (TIGR02999 family)
MDQHSSTQITRLLKDWSAGNSTALEELMPIIYDELRSLAAHYLRRERIDHTLQPTALVHEAYFRLVDQQAVQWQNRAHFFGVAAQMMRRILIDHAKSHGRAKRGGGRQKVDLDQAVALTAEQAGELLALDEALATLGQFDARKGKIVELRYFGGLSVEETAEVLGISPNTVMRDWAMAKAWLYNQIKGEGDHE